MRALEVIHQVESARRTAEAECRRNQELRHYLLDLAREHDDDVNYAEVKLLLAASHPRLALRETPQPVQSSHSYRDERRCS